MFTENITSLAATGIRLKTSNSAGKEIPIGGVYLEPFEIKMKEKNL